MNKKRVRTRETDKGLPTGSSTYKLPTKKWKTMNSRAPIYPNSTEVSFLGNKRLTVFVTFSFN